MSFSERDTQEHLKRLFSPNSIAMIGATNNLGKWGGMILTNVLMNRYPGRIYPVNPRAGEVLGLRAYPRVSEIPGEVDLACIVTPAATVPGLIEECARKNIRTVLVITSDFSEAGEEGRKRERALVETARRCGVRLVGPNSMGVYSSSISLVCMMALTEPLIGEISYVSQSGNIGIHMLGWGKRLKAGFRHFVSSGNEADLSTQDYVRFFGDDPECRSVMVYMESIKGEEDFLAVAGEVAARKPVIVFKGGRTAAGQKAAASHSGALAGKGRVFDGAFRQAGLIQARTTEGFIDCARSLAYLPLPKGKRVGIITRGGGWGVIAADACEEHGLQVPALSAKTIEALDRLLPPYWSRGNPVDMVAVPDIDLYVDCTEALMKDPSVDGVIALGALTGRASSLLKKPGVRESLGLSEEELDFSDAQSEAASERVVQGILSLMRTLGKPLVLVGGWRLSSHMEDLLGREGLDSYPTPERAVRVMARLMEYAAFRRRGS